MVTLMIINSLLSPTFLGFQKQTMIQQNFRDLTRCFLINVKIKNLFLLSVRISSYGCNREVLESKKDA